MACYPLTMLCLLHCVPGAHSVVFSVELFPRDFTDAPDDGRRFWKLLPIPLFFLSVPIYCTSEWGDLSVKLIQSLELC